MKIQEGPTVGFAIPSIPPRHKLLARALKSISKQTHRVNEIHIALDIRKEGAGPTRNRALKAISSEWTCFLDDDDEVNPEHVERLLTHAIETGADVVFPWFDVVGGTDPFPQFEGLPWDPENPRIFPVTVIGRTELLQQSAFPTPRWGEADWAGDDWPFWLRVQDNGARIVHLPERTWKWYHHGGNTSGVPGHW